MSNINEEKKNAVEVWEKVFNVKLKDMLNEAGWMLFWNEDTPLSEALGMLTELGLIASIRNSIKDMVGKAEEEQEGNFSLVYKSEGVNNKTYLNYIKRNIPTLAEAYDLLHETACNTKYTLKDLVVIKEFGNGQEDN